MLDDMPPMPPARPTAERPLAGLTVMVVEDSRFASEAIRLLCLRSGARIRRADSLGAARRHLGVYRPSVVIVDMGLPDGPGAELIAELAGAKPRTAVVIGLSGDPDAEPVARAAGADGFLTKPLDSLAAFQQVLLDALPADQRPAGPRLIPGEVILPDPVSLAEDLLNAADLLAEARENGEFDYLVHFLSGIARSAYDGELGAAVTRMAGGDAAAVARVQTLLNQRLDRAAHA